MSLRWRIALGLALVAALVVGVRRRGRLPRGGRPARDRASTSRCASPRREARGQPARCTATHRRRDRWRDATSVRRARPRARCSRPPAAQVVDADGTRHAVHRGRVAAAGRRRRPRLAGGADGDSQLRTDDVDGRPLPRAHRAAAATAPRCRSPAASARSTTCSTPLRLRLLGLGIAGVGAAALLGWLLARRIVRPVERLRDDGRATSPRPRTSTTPVPVGGPSEIGSLGRCFTTMVDALGDVAARAAAPRERREPRAAHAAHQPAHQRRAARPGRRAPRRAAGRGGRGHRARGRRAHRPRLRAGRARHRPLGDDEAPESVDLAELAATSPQRAERRSGRASRVDHAGEPATVIVRPQMLERGDHQPGRQRAEVQPRRPAPVEVVVTGRGSRCATDGPGIPADDQPHVFDRFYRSDDGPHRARLRSRPRDREAGRRAPRRHGLGHQRDGGGAAVGFRLPPAPPSPDARPPAPPGDLARIVWDARRSRQPLPPAS